MRLVHLLFYTGRVSCMTLIFYAEKFSKKF
nr:MAG TPA: hypothetical protein [Caudoviricetes sp.]